MRPSSLGGRILRRTLSVRPSRYRCHWLRLFGPASVTSRHLANYNDAEGRISYGHLGRTNSCLLMFFYAKEVLFSSASVCMSITRKLLVKSVWNDWT